MNFVCIVFELGDKMLTLSSMENLMVQCNLLSICTYATSWLCHDAAQICQHWIRTRINVQSVTNSVFVIKWSHFYDKQCVPCNNDNLVSANANMPMHYAEIFIGYKNDNITMKILNIFLFLLKTLIVDTR